MRSSDGCSVSARKASDKGQRAMSDKDHDEPKRERRHPDEDAGGAPARSGRSPARTVAGRSGV
jgi:hypothetical protein